MFLGTQDLTLTIDGDDYTAELSDCRIVGAVADAGFVSFAVAKAGGGRKYTLEGTAAQDPGVGSLWSLMWDNAGDEVPFVLRPAGGVTISDDTPTWAGTVKLTEPDGDIMGGTADVSTSAVFTWSFAWECTARPVLDRTP